MAVNDVTDNKSSDSSNGPDSSPLPATKKSSSNHFFMYFLSFCILLGVWYFFVYDPATYRMVFFVENSQAMKKRFDAGTKTAAIRKTLVTGLEGALISDSFSLRASGGDSGGDGPDGLVVPFGYENEEEIAVGITTLEPNGEVRIEQDVQAMLADLNVGDGASGDNKDVLVFIGTDEACEKFPLQYLNKVAQEEETAIEWKLIGLDPGQDCINRLLPLKESVDLAFPQDVKELSWLMSDVLIGDPFRNITPEIWLDIPVNTIIIEPGVLFNAPVVTRDSNGTVLDVELTDAPENATFERKTPTISQFTWIPTDDQQGSHVIIFSVDDGNMRADTVLHIVVEYEDLEKLRKLRESQHRIR